MAILKDLIVTSDSRIAGKQYASKFVGDVEGNSSTATQLENIRNLDGVLFDGSKDIKRFGVCESAASTTNKSVSIENFQITDGAVIFVRFKNTNSVNKPTLNVNSTGSYPFKINGSVPEKIKLLSNKIYILIYENEAYHVVSSKKTLFAHSKNILTADTTGDITVPEYIVDDDALFVYIDGERVIKDENYTEVGKSGTISTSIHIDYTLLEGTEIYTETWWYI